MLAFWRHTRRGSRARLVLSACFALGLLALGDGAHLRHHLMDPGCDSGFTPESHPCVTCSGLHGGALEASAPAVAPCVVADAAETPHPAPAPPILDALCAAPPRAPPLG